MKKTIEKLKQKSYAEKSSIAFLGSALLTGIIATIWLLTIFLDPGSYFEQPQDNELQQLANTGSLFDVVQESFR